MKCLNINIILCELKIGKVSARLLGRTYCNSVAYEVRKYLQFDPSVVANLILLHRYGSVVRQTSFSCDAKYFTCCLDDGSIQIWSIKESQASEN